MLEGINKFWARVRLIVARAAKRARVKMSLRAAKNIFMPKSINQGELVFCLVQKIFWKHQLRGTLFNILQLNVLINFRKL